MKSLIDYIILEELGISNDVIALTSKVKSVIGNDYAKCENTGDKFLVSIPLTPNDDIIVLKRVMKIKFFDESVTVTYYVIDDTRWKNSAINSYFRRYHSHFNIDTNELKLFLAGDGIKISWHRSDSTLQHEIEHWYQQYRKGDVLLDAKHMKRYKFAQDLIRDANPIKRHIGFVYYYAENIEHAAIMNGLYAKIMSTNATSMIEKPEDILKEYLHYKNINNIRTVTYNLEKDAKYKQRIIDALADINKTYDSFIKLSNKTINNYIKGFGRTIYKAKKDLDEQYKNIIY
jgi:hypothetical protein